MRRGLPPLRRRMHVDDGRLIPAEMRSVNDLIKLYTIYLSNGVEAFAALIIALGALQATWKALTLFFARPLQPEQEKTDVRLRLGRWLSLALEFELAADILRTAIAPSWDEIGKLAAIVVLRTLLNYFLEREIRSSEVPTHARPDAS